MRVFSPEWAQAYHDQINQSSAYQESSRTWREGKLALVLRREPEGAAVLLDLLEGRCLGVFSTSPDAAAGEAAFVIEGDEATWRKVLAGRLAPLMGIMRGKLRLSKGSIARLVPYTKGATELVNCAQHLPTEF